MLLLYGGLCLVSSLKSGVDAVWVFFLIANSTEREAAGNVSKHFHHLRDQRLPDRQAAGHDTELCLICSCALEELHRRPCCLQSIYHEHLRLSVQLRVMPPAEILRKFGCISDGLVSTSEWFYLSSLGEMICFLMWKRPERCHKSENGYNTRVYPGMLMCWRSTWTFTSTTGWTGNSTQMLDTKSSVS